MEFRHFVFSMLLMVGFLLGQQSARATSGSTPCSSSPSVPYWDHLFTCDAMVVVAETVVRDASRFTVDGVDRIRGRLKVSEVLWGTVPSVVEAIMLAGSATALGKPPVAVCLHRKGQEWRTGNVFRLVDPQDPPFCRIEVMRKWGAIRRGLDASATPAKSADLFLEALNLLPHRYDRDNFLRLTFPQFPVLPDRDRVAPRLVDYVASQQISAELGTGILKLLYFRSASSRFPYEPDRKGFAGWMLRLIEIADPVGCCSALGHLQGAYRSERLSGLLAARCSSEGALVGASLCASPGNRTEGLAKWAEVVRQAGPVP